MINDYGWAMVHAHAAYNYEAQRRGLFLDPSQIRWSQDAAAQIAEDDDHLRGLIKRHCL